MRKLISGLALAAATITFTAVMPGGVEELWSRYRGCMPHLVSVGLTS
jgi:hypothetical protein